MPRFSSIVLCLFALASAGCQSWPFQQPVRTSYVTPAKRIATIEELGHRASKADAGRQQDSAVELARQIQTESDPLVRESIMRSIAQLQTPMAERVLTAGLKDEDSYVRQTCCRLLGKRGMPSAVAALEETLRADNNLDVRVAATKALGRLGSTDAIPAIAVALHDGDPALQYVGIQAMRLASGENMGNDVAAWQQLASRYMPPDQITPVLAEQPNAPTHY